MTQPQNRPAVVCAVGGNFLRRPVVRNIEAESQMLAEPPWHERNVSGQCGVPTVRKAAFGTQ
jgi:hypothetical protein